MKKPLVGDAMLDLRNAVLDAIAPQCERIIAVLRRFIKPTT